MIQKDKHLKWMLVLLYPMYYVIRMQWLTILQQGQHGISVLSESGDGFTQPQNYAVSAHFRMDKARHIRIQRR